MSTRRGFVALVVLCAVIFLIFIYWFFFIFSFSGGCIEVIQEAKNPITGQVKTFPTPCEVPLGWQKITQVANPKASSQPNETVYPEAPQSASLPVVQLVEKDLSDLLKIPENSIAVLSVDKAQWSDSCLGVDTRELCAQVITPGYKISLRGTGNRIYIYHTDLNKNFILERPARSNL